MELLFPYEVDCMHCGYVQTEYLEPDEWSWVKCESCKQGYHINPTKDEPKAVGVDVE